MFFKFKIKNYYKYIEIIFIRRSNLLSLNIINIIVQKSFLICFTLIHQFPPTVKNLVLIN